MRYIELPCNIGDKAYYISYTTKSYTLVEVKVIGFNIDICEILGVVCKLASNQFTLLIDRVYFDKLQDTQRAYIYSPFDKRFEVDPNTVGQYTGYKDIHNNNIYEGDIIKYPSCNGSEFILIGEVKFGEYKQDGSDGEYAPSICCGFYVEIKKCIYPDWCNSEDYDDFIRDYEKQNSIAEIINDGCNIEVIGNIYV